MAPECAICLQDSVHPVRLPCSHVFCFLCVKGAAQLNNKCPMCRRELTESYFDSPNLIGDIDSEEVQCYDGGYQWFYEGRNGWWLYEKRTSDEIEAAFQSKQPKCEQLIAGFLYTIDFDKMLQYRRNEPQRQRRVKRDKPEAETVKGIAGLRHHQAQGIESCSPTPPAPALPVLPALAPARTRHSSGSQSTSLTQDASGGSTRTHVPVRSSLTESNQANPERYLISRLENVSLRDRYRETYL